MATPVRGALAEPCVGWKGTVAVVATAGVHLRGKPAVWGRGRAASAELSLSREGGNADTHDE